LETRFTRLVGVRLPIMQTGMGWVAGGRLAAATSSAGALGTIASATMTLVALAAAIDQVRDATDNPFGVNLLPDMSDLSDRIDLMRRSGARVASFAGPPSRETVRRLHDVGILAIPTIGAPRHAEKMAEAGVDAIIAQGQEGGGHTGSIPTSLLLPQVVAAVGEQIPVLGAGGFHSGGGLVAALALGADGIAMGTRFLLTKESRVPEVVKQRYLQASLTDTVVTSAIDGVPQRVIATPAIRALERARLTRFPRALLAARQFRRDTGQSVVATLRQGLDMRRSRELTWSQLTLAAQAPVLTRLALVDGDLSAGVLPTGQVVGLIDVLPTVAELIARITSEAEATLRLLAARVQDGVAAVSESAESAP
jgi:NAD(P)H-dependent flavin oxidoreductase YrpB (nitropropane dioxygenase family)